MFPFYFSQGGESYIAPSYEDWTMQTEPSMGAGENSVWEFLQRYHPDYRPDSLENYREFLEGLVPDFFEWQREGQLLNSETVGAGMGAPTDGGDASDLSPWYNYGGMSATDMGDLNSLFGLAPMGGGDGYPSGTYTEVQNMMPEYLDSLAGLTGWSDLLLSGGIDLASLPGVSFLDASFGGSLGYSGGDFLDLGNIGGY